MFANDTRSESLLLASYERYVVRQRETSDQWRGKGRGRGKSRGVEEEDSTVLRVSFHRVSEQSRKLSATIAKKVTTVTNECDYRSFEAQ